MKNTIGKWGEEVIGQWLITQGYEILHSRWRCRYGEIDLIAQIPATFNLTFVEVKTRGINNWDNNGIGAINLNKQAKLKLAGEIFLSEYPLFVDWNCRFDVALLTHKKVIDRNVEANVMRFNQTNNVINYQGYRFQIFDYIKDAF